MNPNRNKPLQEGETEEKTLGCRYSRPDICARHSLPKICAFVTKDGVCYEPPNSWNKLYQKLSENMENTKWFTYWNAMLWQKGMINDKGRELLFYPEKQKKKTNNTYVDYQDKRWF